MKGLLFKCLKQAVHVISGEWLFESGRVANGGAVIVGRALFSSLLLFCLLMAAAAALPLDSLALVDDKVAAILRAESFAFRLMRASRDHFQWFGAIFAALYAALYARFAGQWGYLAGVYNQIKQAEARRECDQNKLSEWKAGFLEDAEELHLATKPLFASVIVAWGDQPEVEAAYQRNTQGGPERFHALIARARRVHLGGGADAYHDLKKRDEGIQALSDRLDSLDAGLRKDIEALRAEVLSSMREIAARGDSGVAQATDHSAPKHNGSGHLDP